LLCAERKLHRSKLICQIFFFRWQLVLAEERKGVYQKICKHTGLSTFEHKLVIKKFAAGFSTSSSLLEAVSAQRLSDWPVLVFILARQA
jgi:hypothetical protein